MNSPPPNSKSIAPVSPEELGEAPPYFPPASEAPPKEIVDLSITAPFHWLRLGWRDLFAAKGLSVFYG